MRLNYEHTKTITSVVRYYFCIILADSPWPSFQNDPQNTGRSKFNGPSEGRINWKYNFTFGAAPSFLTIDKDQNVLLTYSRVIPDTNASVSDYLIAFSTNGDLLWYKDLCLPDRVGQDAISASITNSDGTTYVTSSCGKLLAISSNQTVEWELDLGNAIINGYGGINIDKEGNIYISTIESFYKINKSGSQIWKNNDYARQQAIISPDGNILYMKSRSGTLDAIDTDGNIKWKFPFSNEDFVQYIICDSQNKIYFPYEDEFYCVNSEGLISWKYLLDDTDRFESSVSPTIDKNGNLYFSTKEYLYSLDYDGKLRWRLKDIGTTGGVNLINDVNGNIYAAESIGGNLYSISNEGVINWTLNLGENSYIYGGIAIGRNSTLYVLTENPQTRNSTIYSIY